MLCAAWVFLALGEMMDATTADYTTYDWAFDYLIHNEGTDYVNDARDSGGPTRWGITLATWRAYHNEGDASSIAALTRDQAKAFYHAYFWTPLHADQMPEPIAAALFDMSVLMGMGAAVRMAQAVVGLPQDGIVGPKTRAALGSADAHAFLLHFTQRAANRLAAIVERQPAKVVFLRAWTERAMRLLSLGGEHPVA